MLDDDLLLSQAENVDYNALPASPTPEEFFLLSRVKGDTTVAQLCAASGLGRDHAMGMIEKLLSYGLLTSDAELEIEVDRPRDLYAEESKIAVKPISIAAATAVSGSAEDLFGESGADDADDLFGSAGVKTDDDVDDLFGPSSGHESKNDDLFGGESKSQSTDNFAASGFHENVLIGAEDEDDALFEADSVVFADRSTAYTAQTVVTDASTKTVASRAETIGDDVTSVQSSSKTKNSKRRPTQTNHVTGEEIKLRTTESPYRVEDAPDYSKFPVKMDHFEVEIFHWDAVPDMLQKEILYVYEYMSHLTFYQLFGVAPDADRKEIRSSYFQYSKRFHPDLFFRREVGDLAEKAGEIFKHVTKAYQTVSNKKRRAVYDQQLRDHYAAQNANSGLDDTSKREAAFVTLVRRGSEFESNGDFMSAVDHYKKALGLKMDRELLVRCAILLLRSGQRLDEAANFARTALKSNPGDVNAMVLLGQIYERNQMIEDALSMFERAHGFAPEEPSVRAHVERLRAANS